MSDIKSETTREPETTQEPETTKEAEATEKAKNDLRFLTQFLFFFKTTKLAAASLELPVSTVYAWKTRSKIPKKYHEAVFDILKPYS